ncbi:MAG: 16S rRNA (cytosine(1402)-N(4))-methyltransferase [Clostridia bacterium]|nr:MAG: 16S rRNA (cytosine(1402)-N(4))-methyltransferase [Clostridia bacterium]
MTSQQHIPVLTKEVLKALSPHEGGKYIDATLGGGGHAEAILKASAPDGWLLGLDVDPRAIQRVEERLHRFEKRVIIVKANFRDIQTVAHQHRFDQVDGILLDLGISSFHLNEAQQGFSFQQAGPVDMRMDPSTGPTAAEIINTLEETDLANILYRYGEERRSRRIARAIIENRPILTTIQLAEVVVKAIGRKPGSHIHPATRTFQALRIYVNDELDALEAALPQALSLLKAGGVLAVITFHSLEDRIVKHYFRQESRDCICPPHTVICQCGHKAQIKNLVRKGTVPSPEEIANNPRSRSARLRVALKL